MSLPSCLTLAVRLSTVGPRRRLWTRFTAVAAWAVLIVGTATAAEGDAARYRLAASAPATFALPDGQGDTGDFCRTADGTWVPLATDRQPGKPVTFTLSPAQCSPSGEALVILGKPAWMTLDDVVPPRVTGVLVDGVARPFAGNAIALGCVSGASTEITLTLADDASPLAPDRLELHLTPAVGDAVQLDGTGVQPPQRQGRATIRLTRLPPGAYHGELTLSDLAAVPNRALYTLDVTVFGITIAADQQSLVLAGAGADYRLHAHLSEQLLLPGGIWSKLTTRSAGTWLYPRRFTAVDLVSDLPTAKTVRVKADTQDLEGAPNAGLGALEYDLTVYLDTPALFVTTRSLNLAGKDLDSNASWGWLPAPYYVTASGRQAWRGKATDSYVNVGQVGWLWLAPARPGEPGLVWMSQLRFGESRFDTMLLYSDTGTVKPGGAVEMRFAIAPAATPEAAAAIYQDLVSRGRLAAPPPAAANAAPK